MAEPADKVCVKRQELASLIKNILNVKPLLLLQFHVFSERRLTS